MKVENTFCGNDNGIASVDVYGGISPYQYTWSTGLYTRDSVSNLAPGQYFVIIKDNNGCLKNDTAIIAASTPIQLQLSRTDVLCAGERTGSAGAIVTGGAAPYDFQWTNNTQIYNSNPITNVAAGSYNVRVQDAVGCSVTSSVIINEPPAIDVIITTKSSYCDLNNANASAAVSGGVAPYTFKWMPGNSTVIRISECIRGELSINGN